MKTKFYNQENFCGIYKITNLANEKFYFGSTIRSFKTRYKEHFNDLKKDRHSNKYLQSSFNEHGKEKFLFEIVEVLKKDKQIILKREQEYLKEHFDYQKLCYNLREDVFDTGPWSKNPKQTKNKMKKSAKKAWEEDDGIRRKLVSKSSKEIWKNPKYREKQIVKRKGRKNSKE